MITAKEAHETVTNNIQVEAAAVLEEIDEAIRGALNTVNVPIFEITHVMNEHVYHLVESNLVACGYTVTQNDKKDGRILIKIGWHTLPTE